jgi:hypothetical protein
VPPRKFAVAFSASCSPTALFSLDVWAELTTTALKRLFISKVGSIASPSFATLATNFGTLAFTNDIQVPYSFATGISYDDMVFRLSTARSLGVVYFVVFGSAADLFSVVDTAVKEKFFFECTFPGVHIFPATVRCSDSHFAGLFFVCDSRFILQTFGSLQDALLLLKTIIMSSMNLSGRIQNTSLEPW